MSRPTVTPRHRRKSRRVRHPNALPDVLPEDYEFATAEHRRLWEQKHGSPDWQAWGPYLSERQWGTVREDYSPGGTAWEYFPHDHARSRAYRWGEDGLLGYSDRRQRICFGLALWNHNDPILKERLYGLTNDEGNHGEDVKEIYYYLDGAPTHSYLKGLYKYPQAEFPYSRIIQENRKRGLHDPEFELIDTGVFNDDKYFDVSVEYAMAEAADTLIRITVANRSRESAKITVLPQIWFRNIWSWYHDGKKPRLWSERKGELRLDQPELGEWYFYYGDCPKVLFTENDTNLERFEGKKVSGRHYKDAFHEYVINGKSDAIYPGMSGTKAAGLYPLELAGGEERVILCRLSAKPKDDPFADAEQVFADRIADTDDFYDYVREGLEEEDACRVQRQAFAGMIWTKQFFCLEMPEWLAGDETMPPPPAGRAQGRNSDWLHLNNAEVISMPDKWEYPWYAAWDLAFHCIPLAMIDAEFAKNQLVLLTREWYMHPNGQMPAYEWAFDDVNPPVHAWATWRVFQMDRKQRGDKGDLAFLERVFHKLLLNFTWWVNRKDEDGHNLFQGGFLGLDNIGLFDRSKPLPTGGYIHQSDGTSWMAMYSLNLMRIAIELARHNHVYEDIASKFFEHFLHIAEAMTNMGGRHIGLWDDEDEFYYDLLQLPHGEQRMLKVRSMVGLIPLFAVQTIEPEMLEELPDFAARMEWFLEYRPDLAALVSRWHEPGRGHRRLLSLLRGHRMKALLKRLLDETEFLSDYGVRALSKVYEKNPYTIWVDGQAHSVSYQPAESDTVLFGGNSNWRGPVWFPVNYLLIESLQKFHHYYGEDFQIECPTGSGNYTTILGAAEELTRRLTRIFLRDENGNRAVFGDNEKFQKDPHFKDHILFYEFFHGDNGRGAGAAHQTGWTGLIAKLLQPRQPD